MKVPQFERNDDCSLHTVLRSLTYRNYFVFQTSNFPSQFVPETSRFGISRPAPQTSSKIYTIQNNSGPAQIFNTPASTKTPSVDEDFSVMYYNHSQAGFKYKNLEKSDEDTEHYAFSGKTIEVKGTKLKKITITLQHFLTIIKVVEGLGTF